MVGSLMCGITGFLSRHEIDSAAAYDTVVAMADTVAHRGPDDHGAWVDAEAGIALGHRRLSIVDLSPNGHQPMASASGQWVVSYNGEIYNFPELRRELESLGHRFRGHCDTEVLLAAVEQWGVHAALERFNGMFAFALWDRRERVLHLARDRAGEKPLYYGWMGDTLVFGSELKALRRHPEFRAEIDRDALVLFLCYAYIPAPYSIYRDVLKLIPGTVLSISPSSRRLPQPVPYWSAKDVVERATAQPFPGSVDDAIAELDALLRDAVRMRMVADVPLGAFLSGGIDSSTVVALMQAQSSRPVRTFTIGFAEDTYNEATHAAAVARHLGTEHTELYVTPSEAMTVIPRLPTMYDEPFADASQIPTHLVSALARRDVTVSLSGDAGDELFGGYNRHTWGARIWRRVGWMPRGARHALAAGMTAISPRGWKSIFGMLGPVLPSAVRARSDAVHKLARVLGSQSADALYVGLASQWSVPQAVVVGATAVPPTLISDPAAWPSVQDFAQRMMFLDLVTYLPDDILAKVDRAAMAVSLETRLPLLDPRVIEFAWRLPISLKVRGTVGKWALRQVLHRYVPRELVERPKMGFGVPIGTWLRGALRDWAESLLDESRLRSEGFFDPLPVRKRWDEHLSLAFDRQYDLWNVLMFQAWLENEENAARAPIPERVAPHPQLVRV